MKKRSGKPAGAKKRSRVLRRRPAAPASCNAVFLVGFMGAGKSSVGRALGQRLNWIFEDLDDRIVQRERRSVATIFRDSGEAAFRSAEHAALRQVLEDMRGGAARIVALGGGTFAQPHNHKAIQASGVPTIFLDAPLQELWQRCERQLDANRPLLTSKSRFRETHQARLPYYETASRRIDTMGKQVEAIAAEIAGMLGLKKIAIRTEQGESE